MSDTVIKTQGLERRFGHKVALAGLALEVEQGSIVALLGPNGAGKTTFLRLLMGLLEPTAGEVQILGQSSRPMPDEVACRVGYMADTADPPGWISVKQLVDLKASVVDSFDQALLLDMLAQHNIGEQFRYGSLSKGQKKWVRAAITLAAQPELLLMDEPAEGLDPSARRDLYDRLRDTVNERHATAIVTTHVISDIERVADEVTILCQGRIKLSAWLEDLREQVREVQLPLGEEPWLAPEGIEVLKEERNSHEQVLWLRSLSGHWEALESLNIPLHPVSLETLYLILTEPQNIPLAENAEAAEEKINNKS